jgi:hypothetical protein
MESDIDDESYKDIALVIKRLIEWPKTARISFPY